MPENHVNNQCESGYAPIDLQLISQAAVNLHIARRTLLIYPTTHEQVKICIRRAYDHLSKILNNDGELSLTVLKGGLGVGDQRLQTKNPVFKDLADVLKHYQIAIVTFEKGITIKALARFLQLITIDREKVAARGGIEAVARKAQLSHVRIEVVDYSKLQLTEERQIQRSDNKGHDRGSIWQEFVTHMAARAGVGVENADKLAVDPGLLAKMLNARKMDANQAIAGYQSMFDEAAEASTEKQSLTDDLIKFQQMIRELKPELQNQFLSATFDKCAQTAKASDTANLIDGLGGDLILRMLMQANEASEKISPSLLAFVQKMGKLGELQNKQGDAGQPSGASPEGLTHDKVASLLSPEAHEKYVDGGYAQLLRNLTTQASELAADVSFGDEVNAALDVSQVNIHVGRAMTRLMANSVDTPGYRDWARQLSYLLDDLLASGSFAYLAELMVLMRNERHGCDDERVEIARLVLDRFNDPQFVATAVQMARRSDGQAANEALTFLIELGESVAVEVLEELDPEGTFSGHAFYEKLLDDLGAVAAREALARLNDPRPDYVQRMIRIIRRVGDAVMARQLKPLLEHEDIEVRMEALATLLKFGNNWGLIWLRERLAEPWSDVVCRAVAMAGRYRMRDVVPELIGYVKRQGEVARREAAIRALGEIGDPRAIPELTRLAQRRRIFKKKQARHLKQVMYENLGGYDYTDIQVLLHRGLKQKDPVIRSACKKWFNIAYYGKETGGQKENRHEEL